MLCHRCLRLASTLRGLSSQPPLLTTRALSQTTNPKPTTTTTTTPSQPSAAATTNQQPPKKKKNPPASPTTSHPESSTPAGVPLRGLNFLRNRPEPVALADEEYPGWLWGCLARGGEGGGSEGEGVGGGGEGGGDQFSKSAKQRRLANKRLRAEAAEGGRGEKRKPVPLCEQSVDLGGNEGGTVEGAVEAGRERGEVTRAMRTRRRAGIKEGNFLKGMR